MGKRIMKTNEIKRVFKMATSCASETLNDFLCIATFFYKGSTGECSYYFILRHVCDMSYTEPVKWGTNICNNFESEQSNAIRP